MIHFADRPHLLLKSSDRLSRSQLVGREYLVHIQQTIPETVDEGVARQLPELASDATISRNGDFGAVWGGSTIRHRSNHMDGPDPAGGNILFLDGHVTWREFRDMRLRATPPDHWF